MNTGQAQRVAIVTGAARSIGCATALRPVGRRGRAGRVAAVCAKLFRRAGDELTGQNFHVDGRTCLR